MTHTINLSDANDHRRPKSRISATALAQHNQDELKQRVLAQAQSVSPDDYAFTRTVRSEQTSNGKTEQKVSVEKFDPTKPAEARWTLISVDGAPPSADALKTFRTDSAKRRVPGYYRLAGYFGTPATASTDSHGRTVFHFAALPKDTAKVMDTDVSQNTTADVSVGEANGVPLAEHVHLTVKPMRIKLLMKLERLRVHLALSHSKAIIPLVIMPLLTFAIVVITQVFILLMSTTILLPAGLGATTWERLPFFQLSVVLIYGLVTLALWQAPFYAWLLLVSGWARRATFLWAFLPPLAVCMVEKIAFNTSYLATMLGHRMMGNYQHAFVFEKGSHGAVIPVVDRLAQLDPLKFLSSSGLWIGLMVAAALFAATVRLRRYRGPL